MTLGSEWRGVRERQREREREARWGERERERERESSEKERQIKGKPMTVLTGLVMLLAMIHILVAEYVITFVTLL